MTRAPHRVGLWLVVIALLTAADIWTWNVLCSSQARMLRSQGDTAHCRGLARQISDLRGKPGVAATQELENAEVAAQVERSATAAQIPVKDIVRITPEAPRRLVDSQYLEKVSRIELRQVSLMQLVGFLYDLTATHGSKLQARSLRLSAPREQENGAQWNVEASVGYLIYAPQSTPTRATATSGVEP